MTQMDQFTNQQHLHSTTNLPKINDIEMLECINHLLTTIVNQQSQTHQSPFSTIQIPSISILDYLKRLHRLNKCQQEPFILALIYIDRLQQYQLKYQLTRNNIHRLLLVAIVLAIKYNEDIYYANSYYAKVGGISLSELNLLEKEFTQSLQFDLYVQESLFFTYRNRLVQIYQINNPIHHYNSSTPNNDLHLYV